MIYTVMASYGSLVLNTPKSSEASSFSVRMECVQRAASTSGDGSSFLARYSKSFDRIVPSANPMGGAKRFISGYAGCDEASIVRHRAIALARMKLSISGLEFRFRLPE